MWLTAVSPTYVFPWAAMVHCWWIRSTLTGRPPLPVEAKGLTGAGDSMVAGMCYAIRRRLGPEAMLRYAMAAAGGSVRLEGTLLTSKEDLEELLPQVEITIL